MNFIAKTNRDQAIAITPDNAPKIAACTADYPIEIAPTIPGREIPSGGEASSIPGIEAPIGRKGPIGSEIAIDITEI